MEDTLLIIQLVIDAVLVTLLLVAGFIGGIDQRHARGRGSIRRYQTVINKWRVGLDNVGYVC